MQASIHHDLDLPIFHYASESVPIFLNSIHRNGDLKLQIATVRSRHNQRRTRTSDLLHLIGMLFTDYCTVVLVCGVLYSDGWKVLRGQCQQVSQE